MNLSRNMNIPLYELPDKQDLTIERREHVSQESQESQSSSFIALDHKNNHTAYVSTFLRRRVLIVFVVVFAELLLRGHAAMECYRPDGQAMERVIGWMKDDSFLSIKIIYLYYVIFRYRKVLCPIGTPTSDSELLFRNSCLTSFSFSILTHDIIKKYLKIMKVLVALVDRTAICPM